MITAAAVISLERLGFKVEEIFQYPVLRKILSANYS